jgi:hypothetical protein
VAEPARGQQVVLAQAAAVAGGQGGPAAGVEQDQAAAGTDHPGQLGQAAGGVGEVGQQPGGEGAVDRGGGQRQAAARASRAWAWRPWPRAVASISG